MSLAAVASEAPSLTLATGLLVAGLVLIAAEFFLPTVVLGFLGALVSFAGIYLSAEAGWTTATVYGLIFVVVLGLEFLAFRRLLPATAAGRAMTNQTTNAAAAVPAAAGFALYVGKSGRALTVLAPSGTIEVEGQRLEAFAVDGFVERGAAVLVTEAAAGRVTVRLVR
jgi:membrane-bound serine protease (ClpP class)